MSAKITLEIFISRIEENIENLMIKIMLEVNTQARNSSNVAQFITFSGQTIIFMLLASNNCIS